MSKILCMLLSVAMLLSLAACGSSANTAAKGEANLAAAYDKYLSGFSTNGTNGTLTVAMSPDFAPQEFYDVAKSGDDAIVGFDVLLSNYLAQELDMNLVIKPMSFDAVLAAVQTGNVDIGISGFSWTYERAQNYEISDYYIAGDNETEQSIICLKENEGKFTKPEDFVGSKIGYQGASLQQILVEETFGDLDVDISNVFSDLGTAVEALKAKQIDFLAVAHGNGESIIASANDSIAFTGFDFEVDEIYKNNVCLIQKGNTELLEKVNAALAKALENDYYSGWYDACKVYAGVSTLDELGFDDEGNKITE
ncbi:MAG: transporter substrate-binding domain-containing protein [Oscillospiraceae bacterium]|nr:transporter substrate-binding domain-containing protein [Oscillospiraceae bacterium]